MKRLMNWDYLIVEWANEQIGKSFSFGEMDCAHLVQGAWETIKGEDVLKDKIPSYDTLDGAIEAYLQIGSFEEVLESAGATEIPLNFATYGDVVLQKAQYNASPYQNVAVIVGKNVLIASEDHGRIVTVRLLPWRQQLDDTYTAYRAP